MHIAITFPCYFDERLLCPIPTYQGSFREINGCIVGVFISHQSNGSASSGNDKQQPITNATGDILDGVTWSQVQ
jgi:hypothetical protein